VTEIYVDGGCAPVNPGGTAVYAYIIEGNIQKSDSGVVGSGPGMSNNVAEFQALIKALEQLPEGTTATVYSDSMLLIRVMSGEWHIRSGLYAGYAERALQMAKKYNLKFVWTESSRNKAHQLVEQKMRELNLLSASPVLRLVCECGHVSEINVDEPVKCKHCGKVCLFEWDGNKRVHYWTGFWE
jgi:ribonuclease HI